MVPALSADDVSVEHHVTVAAAPLYLQADMPDDLQHWNQVASFNVYCVYPCAALLRHLALLLSGTHQSAHENLTAELRNVLTR
jgi:hypothetical protein